MKVQMCLKTEIYKSLPDSVKNREDIKRLEGSRYDTVDSTFIYGGKYNIKVSDLKNTPFIVDSEIFSFDVKNNELIMANSAANKIYGLNSNMIKGVQFVITVDGKPLLNGYFWDLLSSYTCNSYHIYYTGTKYFKDANRHFLDKSEGESKKFKIYLGSVNKFEKQKQMPSYPKEFLEAFRKTNRLKE